MSPRAILIVDDDPDDVAFLRQAIEEVAPGLLVLDVHDGQEAIDYLAGAGPFADRERHPLPDLVVLDLKMPRVSGFEVLEWIRERPQFSRLAVTVFSGSALAPDEDRARELGADYRVKPVEYTALRVLARELCREAGLLP